MGKRKGKGKSEAAPTEDQTVLTHPYTEVANSVKMGTGFSKTWEVRPMGVGPEGVVFRGGYDAAVEYATVYGPEYAPYGLFVRRMMMWELELMGWTTDPEAGPTEAATEDHEAATV